MTDDNQTKDEKEPAKVIAKAPEDAVFPELKNLDHQKMYDLVGKFLQRTIPLKGAKLTIIKGLSNRVSSPKAPYIVLDVTDENQISSTETRYTNEHKILWYRSIVTMNMLFVGNNNIPALQMAKSFVVRFNDAWASEQFKKYEQPFYPLYSDDVQIEKGSVNAEDQYNDACFVDAYFEYHPEFGVCEESAKEIVMETNIVE